MGLRIMGWYGPIKSHHDRTLAEVQVNTNADGLSRQRVMTELSVRLGLNQLLAS